MQSNILTAFLIFASVMFSSIQAQSQPSEPRISKQEYIESFSDQAIREMHANGIPASITLAQGMLESDYGNSPLAKYANNHFGIKCHKGWEGPTFIQDDDERNECFRKYYSAYNSYRDHSEFLKTRDRYAFLFDLKQTDYKGWAKGLKKAGYATNPKYADLLIKIIEENGLDAYDKVKRLPEPEVVEEVEKPKRVEEKTPTVLSVRTVKVSDNNIKYVISEKGDTPESVAKRHNMGKWQILKYNDLNKSDYIIPGEIIYLQPKRSFAKEDSHVAKAGESLRDVSQQYGVKMKSLLKMNDLPEGYVLKAGDKLILRNIGDLNSKFTGR